MGWEIFDVIQRKALIFSETNKDFYDINDDKGESSCESYMPLYKLKLLWVNILYLHFNIGNNIFNNYIS